MVHIKKLKYRKWESIPIKKEGGRMGDAEPPYSNYLQTKTIESSIIASFYFFPLVFCCMMQNVCVFTGDLMQETNEFTKPR